MIWIRFTWSDLVWLIGAIWGIYMGIKLYRYCKRT